MSKPTSRKKHRHKFDQASGYDVPNGGSHHFLFFVNYYCKCGKQKPLTKSTKRKGK